MRRLAPLILLLLAITPLGAATLPLAQYAGALARMRSLVASGQLEAARAEAQALAGSEIDSPSGRFTADPTLLAVVRAAKKGDTAATARLDAALAALREAGAAPAVPQGDPQRLARIERQQGVRPLPRGGDVKQLDPELPFMKRFINAVDAFVKWIGDLLDRLGKWLRRFWPSSADEEREQGTPRIRWIVGAIVALILVILGVLAFEVIRRSRRADAAAVEESAPIGSTRDDDPLSRGANEWELYAAQLAAAGRIREAIRAWYNAVLVTLYGLDILRYRKGRTNWEYLAALSPLLPWRASLVQLTQRFEQEWYGGAESGSEALEECSSLARRILQEVRRTKGVAA